MINGAQTAFHHNHCFSLPDLNFLLLFAFQMYPLLCKMLHMLTVPKLFYDTFSKANYKPFIIR